MMMAPIRSATVCSISASFMSNHFSLRELYNRNCRRCLRPPSESASWYVIEGGQRLCSFRAEASEGLRHSNLPGSQFPLMARYQQSFTSLGTGGGAVGRRRNAAVLYLWRARSAHRGLCAMPVLASTITHCGTGADRTVIASDCGTAKKAASASMRDGQPPVDQVRSQ